MDTIKRVLSVIFLSTTILVSTVILGEVLAKEKFPTKPITVICSWAPGGADVSLRALQPHAEKALGKAIVLLYKLGGAGSIGFREGANAAPDGYTITLVTPSIITTPYTVDPDVSYKQFDPIILPVGGPVVITVKADSPWKTFKEFIDYAKSNPGKIRYGNSGHRAMFHIGVVGIEELTGVKFTHVPFKGSAQIIMALMGGHVEAGISTLGPVLQYLKIGKLRILGICSPERYNEFPEVPTFKELGMNIDISTWWGYLAPKGTPKENIKIIHDAFKTAMDTPEFKRYTKEQGLIIPYMGPEEFGKYLVEQDKQWLKIIEYGGLGLTK